VTVVVAAAILRGDPPRLLAAQRAYPADLAGWWELPGGKVDDGEDEQQALIRECREELGVPISIGDRVGADVATVDGVGLLRVWWATVASGDPQPLEHVHLRWLSASELDDVRWLPADAPVIEAIRAALTSSG
jgi:8-oxo-dGTP diphosphatase